MKKLETMAGEFLIGNRDALFQAAVDIAVGLRERQRDSRFHWALAGGSTPKEWYQWCVDRNAIPRAILNSSEWFVSDERHVSFASAESNFGTADRFLLRPLGVANQQKHPWPVDLPPAACAEAFESEFVRTRGSGKCFDLCLLGLGGDGHTASLFPASPLLSHSDAKLFAAVEVPGKGTRFTTTPRGLAACSAIVVMALGESKREPLARVLDDSGSTQETPARLLREFRNRVTWLVDEAAAGDLPVKHQQGMNS